jgi:putative DNA primase/helicase
MPGSQLSRALYYARKLGWHVIPVFEVKDGCCACAAGKNCKRPGKHPRTRNGVHDATTDPDQIRKWWRIWPNANIGVATGCISGILVIDADPHYGSIVTLRAGVKELGRLSR